MINKQENYKQFQLQANQFVSSILLLILKYSFNKPMSQKIQIQKQYIPSPIPKPKTKTQQIQQFNIIIKIKTFKIVQNKKSKKSTKFSYKTQFNSLNKILNNQNNQQNIIIISLKKRIIRKIMKYKQYKNNTTTNPTIYHNLKKDQNKPKFRGSLNEFTKIHYQQQPKNFIKRNSINYSYTLLPRILEDFKQNQQKKYSPSIKQNSKIYNKQKNYYMYGPYFKCNPNQNQYYQQQKFNQFINQRKQINRFSDLKNISKLKTKSNNQEIYTNTTVQYKCQNHQTRPAKFFVCSTQQNIKEIVNYYCLQCAINLSQMHFNVLPLEKQSANIHVSPQFSPKHFKHSQSTATQYQKQTYSFQSVPQPIVQLISFKTLLSLHSENLKNQQNLELIQNTIKQKQQKYLHIMQLLQKIKSQEIIALEKLKLKIWEFIANQERQIKGVNKKLQYLISEYDKNIHAGRDKYKAQGWKQLYQETFDKIKVEFQNVIKLNPKYSLKLPTQITLQQIVKRLQQLLSNTVYQLSFEASNQAQSPSSQKIPNKITQKVLKNTINHLYSHIQPSNRDTKNYDYNEQSPSLQTELLTIQQKQETKKNLKFNSTFGKININRIQQTQQIMSGIDVPISISAHFGNQQNFMINF